MGKFDESMLIRQTIFAKNELLVKFTKLSFTKLIPLLICQILVKCGMGRGLTGAEVIITANLHFVLVAFISGTQCSYGA